MCMEDVRIGRDTQSIQMQFTSALTSSPVIAADENRVTLILPGPLANVITYSINDPAVSGQGIRLGAQSPSIILNIWDHGDLVRRAWTCIHTVAGETLSVLATRLTKE